MKSNTASLFHRRCSVVSAIDKGMIWTTLFLACKSPKTDSGIQCTQRASLQWEYFGAAFFSTYCNSCHSENAPNRFGAPENINFDDFESVIQQSDLIRDSVINRQSMPKGGGLPQSDLVALNEFLTCIAEENP